MPNVIDLAPLSGPIHIDPMIELVDNYLPSVGGVYDAEMSDDGRMSFYDRHTGSEVSVDEALEQSKLQARRDAVRMLDQVLDNLHPQALAYRTSGDGPCVMVTVSWIADLARAISDAAPEARDAVMSREHQSGDAYISLTSCADHAAVVTLLSEMWGVREFWTLVPVTDPQEYVRLAQSGTRWICRGLSLSDAVRYK